MKPREATGLAWGHTAQSDGSWAQAGPQPHASPSCLPLGPLPGPLAEAGSVCAGLSAALGVSLSLSVLLCVLSLSLFLCLALILSLLCLFLSVSPCPSLLQDLLASPCLWVSLFPSSVLCVFLSTALSLSWFLDVCPPPWFSPLTAAPLSPSPPPLPRSC